jgi:hypothetical protein
VGAQATSHYLCRAGQICQRITKMIMRGTRWTVAYIGRMGARARGGDARSFGDCWFGWWCGRMV